VLLKGSTTVVADPGGAVRVNPTGTSWLATAGSGDVLAGLAGSLLAAGLSPLDAAAVAAYLHGLAARRAAAAPGAPVTALDVAAALSTAWNDVRTAAPEPSARDVPGRGAGPVRTGRGGPGPGGTRG
ncbi:NAD(P)H-hydrate dehydratase, partial [Kitasatospora sp. NPDC059462]|uniref:ADP-dependent NAD(P)H-hydrate dehydratase n=1 Tax=Kitasatospora sp. NPDC059462 TaxID=3346841 RepID=UPI0036B228C5